jgi:pheromone shutdown protein TraB
MMFKLGTGMEFLLSDLLFEAVECLAASLLKIYVDSTFTINIAFALLSLKKYSCSLRSLLLLHWFCFRSCFSAIKSLIYSIH